MAIWAALVDQVGQESVFEFLKTLTSYIEKLNKSLVELNQLVLDRLIF